MFWHNNKMNTIHNLVEENGKTIKENNLKKKHLIPIGSLVEAKWDEWFGDGACWKVHARLWVISQERDCDGTPLYSLSQRPPPLFSGDYKFNGFEEESLSLVKITYELKEGEEALEWPDTSTEELVNFALKILSRWPPPMFSGNYNFNEFEEEALGLVKRLKGK